MPTRKLPAGQLRKFRSDVAKLKAKGLVGKRVDARKQRATRYMREQVRKFSDVLEGRAQVVHVPKRAKVKEFSEAFRTKGKSVVVPVKAGETARFNPKAGIISATRKSGSSKITREIYPEGLSKKRAPRKRKNVLYVIPVGNSRQSFDTWEDLVLFMEPYELNVRNPYKDWEKYVEVVRSEDADDE